MFQNSVDTYLMFSIEIYSDVHILVPVVDTYVMSSSELYHYTWSLV